MATGWNPGLVGNAAFSAVFGVVLFLMTKYGLIQPIFDLQQSTMSSVVPAFSERHPGSARVTTSPTELLCPCDLLHYRRTRS
jgi:hypothetical protein